VTIQSNTVIANDLTIYYEESGSGDPLILLHGSMGSGAHWRPYASHFAAHNRVIIPDARDHGRTTFTETDLTRTNPHCLADDVVALMDALALEKAVLCGWSAGGNTALQAALSYPERVKALIVGGTVHHVSEKTQAALMAMGLDGPGKVNLARSQQVIPHLIAEWQQTHAQFPQHWLRLLERRSHLMLNPSPLMPPEELAGIKVPALVIWGDRDHLLPVEQAVEVYRALPNAQLAVIPNADHFVTRTHQAEFGRIVTNFLDNLSHGETR
jgi:pimeloyl-ACP methyl ester carboxylesterase